SVTSPRLNRNQFGANFGGPVWIPKLYKGTDKTFFFSNGEAVYSAQGAASAYRIVIPAAVQTGNFSGVTNARTGAPVAILDPQSGSPFPGNQVPQQRLSTQTLAYLPFEPLPNASNGAQNFLT